MPPSNWCYCGLWLKNGLCPRHGTEIVKKAKPLKIPKYSGRSKSPNKFNDYKE